MHSSLVLSFAPGSAEDDRLADSSSVLLSLSCCAVWGTLRYVGHLRDLLTTYHCSVLTIIDSGMLKVSALTFMPFVTLDNIVQGLSLIITTVKGFLVHTAMILGNSTTNNRASFAAQHSTPMTFAHLNHDHAKTQQLPRLFRRLLRAGEKMSSGFALSRK
ncbi:hypothetical protein BD769DRAFT_634285 [Suillus cothurnatus]|nr:hypothetical protein BD769DRAFT_634285 [Suillus cothurnatus]